MGEPIRDVTIIGGGTAGWLTASAILSAVAIPGQDPPLAITVIESPTIPSIGVGEAALPALHSLIDFLGIDEREFLRRTNAAFKLGGHFVNWNHGPDGEPISFLNIMNRPPDGTVGTIADFFLAFHPEREAPTAGQAYTRLISPATDIVDRRLGPFPEGSGPQRSGVNYSNTSAHFRTTTSSSVGSAAATSSRLGCPGRSAEAGNGRKRDTGTDSGAGWSRSHRQR